MPPEIDVGQETNDSTTTDSVGANVADRIVDSLCRHGVESLIGQSIPTLLFLAGKHRGLRQITVRTEKAGAMIADGYARITGRVPVVTSLAGPATPLMMAGMGEAFHSSIPMVGLFQVVPRPHRDRNYAQDFEDQRALESVAKLVRVLDRQDRVEDYIDQAFVAAASGRPGPVALLLPPDLLEEPWQGTSPRHCVYGSFPLDRTVADPERVGAAAELIANAKNPLIVAGGGCHISGASSELTWFQDELGIPVATTIMGKGAVSETNPYSIGVVGYTMGRYSPAYYQRQIVDNADVILFVGSRTSQNDTNAWTIFPRSATFLHVDVDSREVGRNYESVRLVGDAKLTLAALRHQLSAMDLSSLSAGREARAESIADGVVRYQEEIRPLVTSDKAPVRPERVMQELKRFIDDKAVVCADASYATVWIATYLQAEAAGTRFITPRGLAGIGWGFPIALGVKLGRPGVRVVNISGDGGFGYAWSEMETAARHGLDIVQIVLNNSVLGYQMHAEDASFEQHTDGVKFTTVDHAMLARACGWQAHTVNDPNQLEDALTQAFATPGPVLVEVMTDPDAWPPICNFEGRINPTYEENAA